MRRHDRKEGMATATQVGYGDGLSLEVADRAYLLCSDQLDAAWVKPGQEYNWIPIVYLHDQRPAEMRNDIHFAGGKRLLDSGCLDILHIGEPLATQGIFCHVQGSVAKTSGVISQPEFCRLGRRLRGH